MISHSAPPMVGRSGRFRVGEPSPVWFVVGIYCIVMLAVATSVSFPTKLDELQHLSVIRAQFEQLALFPDWSRYLMLREDDLTKWSAVPNYINHPSLYYILLAPLMKVTGDPLVFRLVNVLLSAAALVIVVIAVRRRFAPTMVSPTFFAIIAASFPKAAVIGGMVNNDNLAALAAAGLFAGMLGLPGQALWIMAALAIAGWTKLTAFLALAAVAGVWLGIRLFGHDARQVLRLLPFMGLGIALGMVPYIATFLRTGHILWVNEEAWRVPMAARAHLDFPGFAHYFLHSFVMKWPASEWEYPFPLAILGLLTPLVLAGAGMRDGAARSLGLAYASGFAILLMIHLAFGWRSFQALGDLTIIQTRYYNVLWPGIALTAAAGIGRLNRRWRHAGGIAVAICLSPTIVGTMIYAGL